MDDFQDFQVFTLGNSDLGILSVFLLRYVLLYPFTSHKNHTEKKVKIIFYLKSILKIKKYNLEI